ncbi:MAG: methyltransferase [Synechococcales cyanobacterium CRU_2_2]|nr:methyltransferase [Synechococcales cyanobacterium CRU_2_2]
MKLITAARQKATKALVYRTQCALHHLLHRNEPYQFSTPYATYAPWKTDSVFRQIYWKIFPYTMVDHYRCYELWQLVEQTASLRGSVIEVGVWRGGTGAMMAKRAESLGIKDPLYLCDTFEGVVKASAEDSIYRGGEHSDTSEKYVQQILDQLSLKNVKILKGIFPDDTAHLIPDNERFRLCHVDVDVYESAKDVVDWVWERLEVGGIVVYDDYGFMVCGGITKFVNEQRQLSDRVVIHNLNGHAIVIKTR